MIEALLAPVDALRTAFYRALAPCCAGLFADRARRVAWLGGGSVVLAFVLTVTVPLWLLTLGPLLLGVPHLLADFRYLVVRPGLHRRAALCGLAALPLVACGFGAPAWVGLLAMAVAVLGARCSWALRLAGLLAWAALTLAARTDESAFVLAFVHLHNAMALALWWALRPRDRRALAVVLLVVAGAALLLVGALDPVVAAAGGWQVPLAIPGLEAHAQAYAPGAEAPWAMRVVLSFAFLQAVHYAIWLRLVPEDARQRPAPRPFRASWRALRDDLGRPLLGLALLLALGIAIWGAVDLIAARAGYLRLATFHGYLELAVAALLLLERRRP
jgi:hypothetical protein